ncbi:MULTISPECIES: TolC family protein [Pseudoalteromonas]|jgi:hypothetical protein|uniref:TolC family protein n=1 Tax=Pseudoalteromonas rhizosphaerae TaxID=2518973 RepID=UPI0012316D70|nr:MULTISPECIES: TolC family protein [Pseudoalteromonas]MBH0067443.1 TolC family protein [Pseudoalteromonas sp. NZS100]
MKCSLLGGAKLILGFMICLPAFIAQANKVVSLEQAVAIAQQNDPWLLGSRLKQQAVENRSIASGSLPDPRISIGMMNFPTDTLDFDQEGMTQFQIGVSQMFPRGDSLKIKEI